MSKRFEVGSDVEWNWGDGKASGVVKEVFTERVTKTLDGSEVVRNATEDKPAYLIEQSDGAKVLKSHSEIQSSS